MRKVLNFFTIVLIFQFIFLGFGMTNKAYAWEGISSQDSVFMVVERSLWANGIEGELSEVSFFESNMADFSEFPEMEREILKSYPEELVRALEMI